MCSEPSHYSLCLVDAMCLIDDQPTIGSEQDNQLLEAAKNGDLETIKVNFS